MRWHGFVQQESQSCVAGPYESRHDPQTSKANSKYMCVRRQLGEIEGKVHAITHMFTDVQTITPALLKKFPVFRDAAVAKHGASYWDVDGCALSLLFQTCEKHIILSGHARVRSIQYTGLY